MTPTEATTGVFEIRPEQPSECDAIDAVQEAAFGRRDEADLVLALREQASSGLSLVGLIEGQVAGHVFLSPLTIESRHPAPPAAALAPLGVHPDFQGSGLGGALLRAGLAACLEQSWKAVFVIGNPSYYERFGFELAAPRGFHYRSEAFDLVLQLKEATPGALRGFAGSIRYHPAFAPHEET